MRTLNKVFILGYVGQEPKAFGDTCKVSVSTTNVWTDSKGEKKEETERKDKGYLYSERRYGSFHRQISLPSDVDQNEITAGFKDGVLTVTLAKDENVPARSRKIEIGKD